MAYDDIQENLAGWINFLKEIKKDVSKNHGRNYPNILNGLKKLSKTIRPLEGISSIQNNDVIRRKIDKIENESKDLQDIVSDMIKNPANNNYIKVTEHLDNLIDRCNELPNDLASLSDKPASDSKAEETEHAKGSCVGNFFWKLYEKTLKVIVDAVLERWWPKNP
jgi:hypothetical protein